MNMESTCQQRIQRKKIQKQIFSPSEYDRYILVVFDENNEYKILKNTDVINEKDGEVDLKNGESATLLVTGKTTLK